MVQPSPCTVACPAGVNVKSYISLIAAGRFGEALNVVRERNPLPGICGRVCTHPCESHCFREEIDSPVSIRYLKRFVADWELNNPVTTRTPFHQWRSQRIAIVGSGPAGLTAAYDLVRLGFGVMIFEAMGEPGGMLTAAIPSFRLPSEIIRTEVDAILACGVDIQLNSPVTGANALQNLLDEGYDAVFLAVGAHEARRLGIPGEDAYAGVVDSLEFLKSIKSGSRKKVPRKVIVIGGGSAAIDSARSAIRLEAAEVTIVYRRSKEEMPAHPIEIADAKKEGVRFQYLAGPLGMIGESGQITKLACQRMELGAPDDSGRRRPVPIEGSEFEIETDLIVVSISEKPDLKFLKGKHKPKLTSWGTFAVDNHLATNRPGIFAGGDAVSGPSTVIDAIAAGHQAAESIVAYLEGSGAGAAELTWPHEMELYPPISIHPQARRMSRPMLRPSNRRKNFKEVEQPLSAEKAILEAQRCLRCGPCSECHLCVSDCPKQLALSTDGSQGDRLLRWEHTPVPGLAEYASPGEWITALPGVGESAAIHPLASHVNEALCRGCGDCLEVCGYAALTFNIFGPDRSLVEVETDRCKGCGLCVAVCPTGAMEPGYDTRERIEMALLELRPDKSNIVMFGCYWNNSLTPGTFRRLKRNGVAITTVRTMCVGRLESAQILKSFELGAAGVIINSCGSGKCHYEHGFDQSMDIYRKTELLMGLLGIDQRRLLSIASRGSDTGQLDAEVTRFVRQLSGLETTGRKERLVEASA